MMLRTVVMSLDQIYYWMCWLLHKPDNLEGLRHSLKRGGVCLCSHKISVQPKNFFALTKINSNVNGISYYFISILASIFQ